MKSFETSFIENRSVVNFFKLASCLSTMPNVNSKEWFLTNYCLDELNYRQPQIAFLCSSGICFWAGKRAFLSFPHNWCKSVYVGLVFYDLSLHSRNPFPATQYWISVSTLESDIGRAARRIYTPGSYSPVSFTSYEHNSLISILGQSLILRRWAQYTFEKSCFRQSIPRTDSKLTLLRISSNFFDWDLVEIISDCSSRKIKVQFLPSFRISNTLLLSHSNRDVFFPHMSLLGRCWYTLQFMLVDFFKKIEVSDTMG